MSDTPTLRLFRFARPGTTPCWHLAEVEPTNPKRIVRFVKQSRTALQDVRRAWGRTADRNPGGRDDGPGPLARAQVVLLEQRITELAARAALNELLGELNLR